MDGRIFHAELGGVFLQKKSDQPGCPLALAQRRQVEHHDVLMR